MSGIGAIKTFAIDVDSVLADTMIVWTNEYNKRKGTNITKNDITSWDISRILPVSSTEISSLFNYIWKYRWQEIPPSRAKLGDTTRRIHRLGYRISILTKRERPTVPYVAKWLDHYDVFSDDLLFVYDDMPKAEYPFDIIIDDAPSNLIDLIPPKLGILFNQPWNKDFDWPIRVNSLEETEQML
jgi:5'(3')-deoxyribonucleotidase